MNSIMPYHNINTGVDHKFTIYTATYGNSVFATLISQHLIEMQSPSVTMSGYLWQQELTRIETDNPSITMVPRLSSTEVPSSSMQTEKNAALLQLLSSWREGDEQEQRETLQYLQQALDEDRLSDRKLFP